MQQFLPERQRSYRLWPMICIVLWKGGYYFESPIGEKTALDLLGELMALYARMDEVVAAFQLQSGLRCPAGCGSCCTNTAVQVTFLGMLPMAQAMLCDGTAAQRLERLSRDSGPAACFLYTAHPTEDAAGHCGYYPWRPGLCRLFGFAAVRGRTGSKSLSICGHIRENDLQVVASSLALAADAPCFVDYGTRIYGLDPVSGTCLMPINIALRRANECL